MAQADLTYYLDDQGYSDVASDDSNRDPITSSSNYPVFIFKKKNTNSIDQITINWDCLWNVQFCNWACRFTG